MIATYGRLRIKRPLDLACFGWNTQQCQHFQNLGVTKTLGGTEMSNDSKCQTGELRIWNPGNTCEGRRPE